MQRNDRNLVERIQALSAEQLAEVEDFVDFLRFRMQERELSRASTAVSELAFQRIWSNPEDDVYDGL